MPDSEAVNKPNNPKPPKNNLSPDTILASELLFAFPHMVEGIL